MRDGNAQADETLDLRQDDTLQPDGYALGLASGVSQMALGGGSTCDGTILIDSFVVGDLIPELASRSSRTRTCRFSAC